MFDKDDLSFGFSVMAFVEQDHRSGPCEDDCEVTCPYIGMLPDESDDEDGSPLDFG
jgi:hypothetical protein